MKDLIYKNITLRYTEGGGFLGNDVWLGDTSWGKVEIEKESKEHGEGFFWWTEFRKHNTDGVYYDNASDCLKGFYEYMTIGNVIL